MYRKLFTLKLDSLMNDISRVQSGSEIQQKIIWGSREQKAIHEEVVMNTNTRLVSSDVSRTRVHDIILCEGYNTSFVFSLYLFSVSVYRDRGLMSGKCV